MYYTNLYIILAIPAISEKFGKIVSSLQSLKHFGYIYKISNSHYHQSNRKKKLIEKICISMNTFCSKSIQTTYLCVIFHHVYRLIFYSLVKKQLNREDSDQV